MRRRKQMFKMFRKAEVSVRSPLVFLGGDGG
jgi:hypothetical protein